MKPGFGSGQGLFLCVFCALLRPFHLRDLGSSAAADVRRLKLICGKTSNIEHPITSGRVRHSVRAVVVNQ